MNVTVSAVRMVLEGPLEAVVDGGPQRPPLRCSSLIRSKNTMYESAVIPIDTMMPVTPASVSVVPWNSPSRMIDSSSSDPKTVRPITATRPSAR